MFVLASCSKEDAKENTACIAQCLLAKENGQDFAGCNNEERTIQNEKLNIILKRLEKQDSVLITLKAELAQANRQQDSVSLHSDNTTQEVPSTSQQPIDCDTRVAETTPEPAPIAAVEENKDDYNIPEIRKKDDDFKEKALTSLVSAGFGAAATYMATKKFDCDKTDVLTGYILMQACVNNCGYGSEEKCANRISDMLCKERLNKESILEQTRSSCIL